MSESRPVPFSPSPDFTLISQAAAAAFAAARLLHFGLRRRFPLLLSWLLAFAVSSIFFSVISASSPVYYTAYMVWQPLSWLIEALAVREMFTLIFRDYPGLQTVGKWALYAALAFSGVASLAIFRLFPPEGSNSSPKLWYELVTDRSVGVGLTLIIGVLMWFLSTYPLRLDRNTCVSSSFFSALFLAQGAIKLIDSISLHLSLIFADRLEVAFSAICFVAWGVMLRAGSAPPAKPQNPDKPREAELLQQLETLNEILGRSVRR